MVKGKFIFSQVIDFLPRYEFDKIVKKYKGDYRYRHLSSYNHLLHLIFGQLSACDSLRDICLCLKAHEKCLYHLGFRQTVNESSLSKDLLTKPTDQLLNQNQNVKELCLFENLRISNNL